MAKTTTNKSLRVDAPHKATRRRPLTEGEIDAPNRTAGASGSPATRRRPGRAAALRSASPRTRTQKSRAPAKGAPNRRRGTLAKGSRTAGRAARA